MGQRLELSCSGLQEQSLHGHAAEAPSLQLSDPIAGGIARDDIGTEKEMRVHFWATQWSPSVRQSQPRYAARGSRPQLGR
jgi:hypothetical protein